jgi:hypothetical protein
MTVQRDNARKLAETYMQQRDELTDEMRRVQQALQATLDINARKSADIVNLRRELTKASRLPDDENHKLRQQLCDQQQQHNDEKQKLLDLHAELKQRATEAEKDAAQAEFSKACSVLEARLELRAEMNRLIGIIEVLSTSV